MARAINRDHEHYVLKNRMLAAADDMSRRDRKLEKKGLAPSTREKSCFSCKLKRTCTQFRSKRSGRASGVVSFGGTDETMVCEKYEPAPRQNRGMSDKQIKSLMKGFKRGI